MNDLTSKKCVPCEIGTPPMKIEEIKKYLPQIKDWLLLDNKIIKEFKFKNFKEAMRFVNQVAQIAESEGHHPDIKIVYNKVTLILFTHAAKGLTENDFILAAKINQTI